MLSHVVPSALKAAENTPEESTSVSRRQKPRVDIAFNSIRSGGGRPWFSNQRPFNKPRTARSGAEHWLTVGIATTCRAVGNPRSGERSYFSVFRSCFSVFRSYVSVFDTNGLACASSFVLFRFFIDDADFSDCSCVRVSFANGCISFRGCELDR